MRIVGVAGHARAGKDTVAQWLEHNRGAVRLSFAGPIKRTLESLFGFQSSYWDGPEKELPLPILGRSPRELAQTLGTDWGRNMVHPDIWVLVARRTLENMFVLDGQIVVISDVRFDNEAALVRERGMMLHVYRDGADGKVGVLGHESEVGVECLPGDVLISNNGTIDELHAKLGGLFPRSVAAF